MKNYLILLVAILFNMGTLVAQTNISDEPEYRNFCKSAVEDEKVFENFKRSKIYNNHVEHVSFELGGKYLNYILGKYPALVEKFEMFRSNDALGNPIKYNYDAYGDFSPTTLRYIKIAGDLQNIYSTLDTMRVIEIGGGYGGQCKILSDLFEFQEYIIVDLPEPLELTKKYLTKLGVQNVTYWTPDQVPADQSYDLVISNYAFSECSREQQTEYLTKIIKNSKYGYMTWNYISNYMALDFYEPQELRTILKDYNLKVTISPESPSTDKNNRIFTWKP